MPHSRESGTDGQTVGRTDGRNDDATLATASLFSIGAPFRYYTSQSQLRHKGRRTINASLVYAIKTEKKRGKKKVTIASKYRFRSCRNARVGENREVYARENYMSRPSSASKRRANEPSTLHCELIKKAKKIKGRGIK